MSVPEGVECSGVPEKSSEALNDAVSNRDSGSLESELEDDVSHLFPIDLTKNEGVDKRTKVVRELFTSEQIYVTNLSTIIEGYVLPMKSKNILNPKVISGIFSNIEIIQKFHVHFAESMSQRLKKWDYDQLIGDIFLSLAPYLKIYSQYCSNYDNSMSLVQQHKKSSPEFVKFLEKCQGDPMFKGSYITSFLILPIQRIPRYELFLKELLKTTKSGHPDKQNLEQALGLVATLAESVDESCQKAENIHKMSEIAKAIAMEKLLKPARKYVREDEIELTSEVYVGPSKCYVFNDLIVVTVRKSKLNPRLYLSYNLGYCWVFGGEENIQLITKTNTLHLKFTANEIKNQWEADVVQLLGHIIETKKLKDKRSAYKIVEEGGIYRAIAKDLQPYIEANPEYSPSPTTSPTSTPPPEKKKKNRSLNDTWKKRVKNIGSSLKHRPQDESSSQNNNNNSNSSSSIHNANINNTLNLLDMKVSKTKSASPRVASPSPNRPADKQLRRSVSITNTKRGKTLDSLPLQMALNDILKERRKANEV